MRGDAERLEDAVCRFVYRCCLMNDIINLIVIYRAIIVRLPSRDPLTRQCREPTMGALHRMLAAATRRPRQGEGSGTHPFIHRQFF